MKNQMKFFIALFALAFFCSSVFSAKMKIEAKVEAKSESEAKTETQDADNHEHEDEVDCDEVNKEITKSNSVLKSNSPKDIPHPKCTKGCRNPWQNKNHRWTRIPQRRECLKFHDVGVNSQGVIVVVGADGKLYYYNFDMDTMEEIEGDHEISKIRRVDIGYDGLIYIVTISGDTYYLTCSRYWVKLDGCAIDIGTGRGDEVVKIGCNDYCEDLEDAKCIRKAKYRVEKKSPHIYKLHCDCICKCCRRRCNLFVKHVFTCEGNGDIGKGIDRKCYWIKYPAGPVYKKDGKFYLCDFHRIDVNSNGYPMVAATCGNRNYLYQMIGDDKNVFVKIFYGGNGYYNKIVDLCGDNLGNIFYIFRNRVYIYSTRYSYVSILGMTIAGDNISCGPYAQPTITDKDCCLWTTTKVRYN